MQNHGSSRTGPEEKEPGQDLPPRERTMKIQSQVRSGKGMSFVLPDGTKITCK